MSRKSLNELADFQYYMYNKLLIDIHSIMAYFWGTLLCVSVAEVSGSQYYSVICCSFWRRSRRKTWIDYY